ncbi:MAG: nitrilase-related carbon-nitrogen hydrolase [Verrucomicrobiota bacterium]|nr:nitrilase-related carbon-nitrogen hydrolase [Verrucomicrobiota bacterium]
MKIYGIQTSPKWEDKSTSFAQVEQLLRNKKIEAKSLVVLPESFSTGFSLNTQITAKGEPEVSMDFLSQLAKQYNCWVMAGLIVKEQNKYFNRLICLSPEGKLLGQYDKMHLIHSAGEQNVHSQGDDCKIIHLNNWNICPVICYDLRFPEFFRKGMDMGANLYVVIACWPKVRVSHWKSLIRARAIENQSYVIGVNRTGKEPRNIYSGNSMFIDPQGEIIQELGDEVDVIIGQADINEVINWRKKFPVLEDVRTELFSRLTKHYT